ncbi:restriction endonuclease subunit S [Robbsia andropogonis]|uniref:restriction endonuclease subunit S n=1 Tax=Robbsia andropogonis TaxID=28092 RepID=UPI000464F4B2|nr:restriction endonuclease subunit S [Robbsia andropogonis]
MRDVHLEDVAQLTVGHVGSMVDEYVDAGIPFLRSLNILPHRIDVQETKFITRAFHEKLRKSALRPDDVVIVRTGKPGTCAVIPEELAEANCSDLVIVRCGPQIRPRFLAYWVNAVASEHVASHIVGAVQQHFNVGAAKRMPIRLPCLRDQDEVLAILGALDDKIELNRKTAATLEEMARALYRSWFVDFDPVRARAEGRAPAHMDAATAALFPDSFGEDGLPVGWHQGILSDLALLNPTAHSKKSHPSRVEYVDLANTKWGSIEGIAEYDWDAAPSRARLSLRTGDTIIGTVRPGNGSYSYVGRDGLTGSTGFAVLRPKVPCDAALIYLATTDPSTIEELANLADGGAYPAVRPDVVASRPVNVAPDNIRTAFSCLASLFIRRVEAAKTESLSLANLRDMLLPRLMSGELRVGAARELVEEAA